MLLRPRSHSKAVVSLPKVLRCEKVAPVLWEDKKLSNPWRRVPEFRTLFMTKAPDCPATRQISPVVGKVHEKKFFVDPRAPFRVDNPIFLGSFGLSLQ
ncbi:unnamed protein product [Caenorhabditis auriculariae]|uniref:Uncharacterized protein n=1 Tax=Caenorhabditis auriculariae TaxID=2777116 RepID=A0A8S1H5U4_9PELO|nr:unnamed protein product [Caenorhabditis auriculariae]